MISARSLLMASLALMLSIAAAGQGLDTSKIDQVLGRSGQQMGEVYRVGFPVRTCMSSLADLQSDRVSLSDRGPHSLERITVPR